VNQIEILPVSQSQPNLAAAFNADDVTRAFQAVAGGMARVNKRIEESLSSDAHDLTTISKYLLELGGKRVRPLLTLLSARLLKMINPDERVIDVAAGIEMIHMATLLHDDIIDQSPTRRRKPSAYVAFGLPKTLLTGDFLLVRAFGLCAKLDKFIIESTEQACVELTEGEILEGRIDIESGSALKIPDLEFYLDVIGKKTASLFALSTSVGSYLAGGSPAEVEALRSFGRNAGIAFQMVDDILDVTADEDLLGKPSGTDLKQKTPSLINILWLQSRDEKAIKYFSNPAPSVEESKTAARELKNSSVIADARRLAQDYASQALSRLEQFPDKRIDPETRQHLSGLIRFTLDRCL
jgi:geranylgeranyl pyrophosphate synthase